MKKPKSHVLWHQDFNQVLDAFQLACNNQGAGFYDKEVEKNRKKILAAYFELLALVKNNQPET